MKFHWIRKLSRYNNMVFAEHSVVVHIIPTNDVIWFECQHSTTHKIFSHVMVCGKQHRHFTHIQMTAHQFISEMPKIDGNLKRTFPRVWEHYCKPAQRLQHININWNLSIAKIEHAKWMRVGCDKNKKGYLYFICSSRKKCLLIEKKFSVFVDSQHRLRPRLRSR